MSTDEAAIERMARAVAVELMRGGSRDPDSATDKYWAAWRGEMEAALAALVADRLPRTVMRQALLELRDPSRAMMAAGAALPVRDRQDFPKRGTRLGDVAAVDCWRAMIDAKLAEA